MRELALGCSAYLSGENAEQWTAVQADMSHDNLIGGAAGFQMAFNAGAWLGMVIHVIGVEVYVSSFLYIV